VAALAPEHADEALRRWHEMPEGREAACIGVVEPGRMPVVLRTALGGQRVLEELEHDPLPRIC
jgi:hydrogenase expression/formation protein HypE